MPFNTFIITTRTFKCLLCHLALYLGVFGSKRFRATSIPTTSSSIYDQLTFPLTNYDYTAMLPNALSKHLLLLLTATAKRLDAIQHFIITTTTFKCSLCHLTLYKYKCTTRTFKCSYSER